MPRNGRPFQPINSRRSFLKSTVATGAAAVLYPALGAARTASSSSAAPADAPSASADVKPFELDEITIPELQDGMKSGRFTARSLVEKYSARIDEIDKRGPAVNAIIEMNPDALAIADALDQERKAKGPRGPLHGIPVLIKDNIDTADRMMTTAGSLALVGSKPQKDSLVAQKLRAAGAVILGKTNLSEWANIRSSHSTSGWSGRGGLTKNPYALDRNPCGSSSGTGARHFGEPGSRGHWHGNGRVDCLSVVVKRPGRDQADGGPGQPGGHYSDFAQSGWRWADVPHVARCGDHAGRADRSRSR